MKDVEDVPEDVARGDGDDGSISLPVDRAERHDLRGTLREHSTDCLLRLVVRVGPELGELDPGVLELADIGDDPHRNDVKHQRGLSDQAGQALEDALADLLDGLGPDGAAVLAGVLMALDPHASVPPQEL